MLRKFFLLLIMMLLLSPSVIGAIQGIKKDEITVGKGHFKKTYNRYVDPHGFWFTIFINFFFAISFLVLLIWLMFFLNR